MRDVKFAEETPCWYEKATVNSIVEEIEANPSFCLEEEVLLEKRDRRIAELKKFGDDFESLTGIKRMTIFRAIAADPDAVKLLRRER